MPNNDRYEVNHNGEVVIHKTALCNDKSKMIISLFSQYGWDCKEISVEGAKHTLEISKKGFETKNIIVFSGNVRNEARSAYEKKIQIANPDPRKEDKHKAIILGIYVFEEDDSYKDAIFIGYPINDDVNYPSPASIRGTFVNKILSQAKANGFVYDEEHNNVGFRPEFAFYYLENFYNIHYSNKKFQYLNSDVYDEPTDNNIINAEKVIGNGGSNIEKTLTINIKREPLKNKIHPLNLIVYGAPGTSKTYKMPLYALAIIEGKRIEEIEYERSEIIQKYKNYLKDGRIVFTTFHQNYGYEDFIQGLRPDPKVDKLKFNVIDGVFKRIADKAMDGGNNSYVIIIDEINRGNISKIFGELITLIEPDKRWGEENEMSVTLPSGDVFAVPNNLYIIGTMNSADKSISLIDAALRRRFDFEEMIPDKTLISDKKLSDLFEKMNFKLHEMLESSDLLIGHSYFIGKTYSEVDYIMNRNIIPLLYEYFYDNKNKVIKYLNDVLEGTEYKLKDNKFGRLRVEKESKGS